MKVGTRAMSSNFFAYTALTKPASEKITEPSSTEAKVIKGCMTCSEVKNSAMPSTSTPTTRPRTTAPVT